MGITCTFSLFYCLKCSKCVFTYWPLPLIPLVAAEKKRRTEDGQQPGASAPVAPSNGTGHQPSRFAKPPQEPAAPPNNILFLQNMPDQTTSMMLQILFQQYPGFREVRMIEAKPGIAFVEYEDENQSMVAMEALQGFKISPENPMAISYAKK
ncbi:unnamed protein product [Triticum turgidum subsp. durum]|uniref:RRM domain-containing protein n=1 Tax=Triticum turgidum subsp. durum TaxID=4567 RepID=A0A9R0S786_TRITD|nr:unnamed protein product [Triticum turgidum subsp. durum]